MFRSFFISLGMFVLLWGATFLTVERVVLNSEASGTQQEMNGMLKMFLTVNADNKHELNPPDWAAFAMMAFGSLTILYSISATNKQV